jgi:hypothetical protein
MSGEAHDGSSEGVPVQPADRGATPGKRCRFGCRVGAFDELNDVVVRSPGHWTGVRGPGTEGGQDHDHAESQHRRSAAPGEFLDCGIHHEDS